MAYQFFIQRHPKHGEAQAKVDLEQHFDCEYMELKNSQNAEIKNIYVETIAETNESNIYLPDDVAYNNADVTLSVMFVSDNVVAKSNALWKYIAGYIIDLSDNLRGHTVTLLPKKFTIRAEKLYRGKGNYQVVDITCERVNGRPVYNNEIRHVLSGSTFTSSAGAKWSFQNGYTINNDEYKTYSAAGGYIKFTRNVTFTIDVPDGIVVESVTIQGWANSDDETAYVERCGDYTGGAEKPFPVQEQAMATYTYPQANPSNQIQLRFGGTQSKVMIIINGYSTK